MYQALYRKYRPKTFNDVVDQDNTKRILINSIKNNKISHAYLFSGPRGIGKTSIAKLFAKAVNCTNFSDNDDICNNCKNCQTCNDNIPDIIEIDAASNNGVDQIRELKSKVNIVPSLLKYKVYIIDEVHMLTDSAFNALLKTIEEPPSYVIFILATTEFYKVPETIVSRCQCFNFIRISDTSIEDRINKIAKLENIKIDKETVTEIADFSTGGLRDAIGMLDKLASFTNNNITIEDFRNINGIISINDLQSICEYILKGNNKEILNSIEKINNMGCNFNNIITRMMLLLRDKICNYYLKKEEIEYDVDKIILLVSNLNDLTILLKNSLEPMITTQISLLKISNTLNKNSENISQAINLESKKPLKNISQEISEASENIIKHKQEKNNTNLNGEKLSLIINDKTKEIRINNALATADIKYKKLIVSGWDKLKEYFDDKIYAKISQVLYDTVPIIVGNEYLVLSSNVSSLIEKIYNNFIEAEKLIEIIYNQKYKIVIVTDEEFKKIKEKFQSDKKNKIIYQVIEENEPLVLKNKKEEKNDNLINKAINIFGSDYIEIE